MATVSCALYSVRFVIVAKGADVSGPDLSSPPALGAFLLFGSVGLGPALTLAVVRFAWLAAERKYTWWDWVGSV